MPAHLSASTCQDCPIRVVCRCLQITEEVVIAAVSTGEITTLKELRQCTGAGDGCTACHATLARYLEAPSVPAA